MDSLLYSRYLSKLSFLHATSQAQVLSYLSLLQARHYAQGTVDTVVTIIKKFCLSVPEPRQAMIHGNLAQATVQDVDGFIKTASAQGLSPATINTALSLLKAFFDFLHEEGQMPHQPILRHRHRLVAPTTLPKPMPEADLLRFFTLKQLIEGKRVTVEISGVDRYKRLLSTIFLDSKNMNLAMIEAGLAEVYRGPESGNPYRQQYQAAEETARSARKHIWVQGDTYESPRAYRKQVGIS